MTRLDSVVFLIYLIYLVPSSESAPLHRDPPTPHLAHIAHIPPRLRCSESSGQLDPKAVPKAIGFV